MSKKAFDKIAMGLTEVLVRSRYESKVRENKVRRIAKRRGLVVIKAGVRDPQAIGFGLYALHDSVRKRDIFAPFTATLEDVESYLA